MIASQIDIAANQAKSFQITAKSPSPQLLQHTVKRRTTGQPSHAPQFCSGREEKVMLSL